MQGGNRYGMLRSAYVSFMSLVGREEDTPQQRTTKALLFPCSVLGAFVHVVLPFVNRNNHGLLFLKFARGAICACLGGYAVVTKTMPLLLVEGCIISYMFFFSVLSDIATYGIQANWVSAVVLFDCMLLTNCRPLAINTSIAIFIAYLIIKSFEEAYAFGFYDAFPFDSGLEPDPPRGTQWIITMFVTRITFFLLDFLLTRRFATGMRKEQMKAQQRAELAGKVAGALASFDLDVAERLVNGEEEEEEEEDGMREAFKQLLSNLRQYRPYLPDALFGGVGAEILLSSEEPSHIVHARNVPPGLSTDGTVAIAFTDIQSSTDIWEKHTGSMRVGMATHNHVVRECLGEYDGYEVKTIGDAFMAAFDDGDTAFRFAITVQERLATAQWTEDLLTHPLCRAVGREEDGTLCWRGLRVRIGLHKGPTRLETNPTTGRTDYMGPTVNKAARVEGAAVGGAVAATREVLVDVDPGWLDKAATVFPVGEQQLKGVGEVFLHFALPRSLGFGQRKAEVLSVVRGRKGSAVGTEAGTVVTSGFTGSVSDSGGQPLQRGRITEGKGTVCHVRAEYGCLSLFHNVTDAVNHFVCVLIDAAERSEGVVLHVSGSSVVLGWNTGKPCTMHVAQTGRFVGWVHSGVEGTCWQHKVAMGLCTGRLLHGTVGTAKQRFFPVIGSCVEEAAQLAGLSTVLGGPFCLLTGAGCAATDPSLTVHTRPVLLRSGGCGTIYQFNAKTLQEVDGVWGIFDGLVPSGWGQLYKDAFRDADADAVLALAHDTCDPVLSVVANTLAGRADPLAAATPPEGFSVPSTYPTGWLGEQTHHRLPKPSYSPQASFIIAPGV